MAKAEIDVAIERVVHDTLRHAIQKISNEHGLQLQSLSVEWTDVSTYADGSRFLVRTLHTETFSRHP